jgi:Sulfite exporter TauE/SafE
MGRGARRRRRAGRVRWRTGLIFGLAGMTGAYTGGRLAAYIPGGILLTAFALMMLATAVAMIRGRRATKPKPVPHELPILYAIAAGIVVGLITGLVGAGGGFLVVPALTLLGGLPMPVAVGRILTPASVTIEFQGNPTSNVVAMPDDVKIVTGDAKAVTNGPKNANAKWTCTGFENRTTTKYPLCQRQPPRAHPRLPEAAGTARTPTAPTTARTWSSRDRDGSCPTRFKAIAQLRYTLTYNQPSGLNFALDTFPEDNHVALTDHGDFEAVMSRQLRNDIAACINSGRTCTNTGRRG